MKKMRITLALLSLVQLSYAQVYVEKQTRHRFAQLNFGVDVQTNFGGTTAFLNAQGEKQTLDFEPFYRPRLIFGGTHFWGHADFYVAFPVFHTVMKAQNQTIDYNNGVETVFKYYPWRIGHHKIRPFVGIGLTVYAYEQDNDLLSYGDGPDLNYTTVPVLAGFTFNHKQRLIELGFSWNYSNQRDYYISKDQKAKLKTPPFHVNLSYRFQVETTLSAEKNWESGRTKLVTEKLAEMKRLNSFYIGAGFSSAFWTTKSSYNKENHPYMEKFPVSVMPDLAVGYYLHQPDLNMAMCYRGYREQAGAYGTDQKATRRSLGVEVTKNIGDYHGFVPFIGPILSWEYLRFEERIKGKNHLLVSDHKMGYGVTFGWDIRPNRLQAWILRTNLRWFPKLDLEVENGTSVAFGNIEFNFIQLIVYPGRMM
tara:strand:- start:323 stop:1588 length:1266 start_codon:yes stop_codon:yes gene_type:complete